METLPAMFHCDRLKMKLTKAGCSRLWKSARDKDNVPKPWEGRAACVTCPIGATNSGVQISPVAEDVAILKRACPRCLRQSERIIEGMLCISCYNRQAEADRGRNAKGSRPRLCARLRDLELSVISGDEIELMHVGRVTSAAEAILRRARRAEVVTSFGWPASGPGNVVGIMA